MFSCISKSMSGKLIITSVAKQHHFYAAVALGVNFNAAPAPAAPGPAPVPTLL
jgi:hypothetical protein